MTKLQLFMPGVLAYLCHEMGHVLAMLVLDVPFVGVELRRMGLCVNRKLMHDWRDNAVTAAGICMNLFLFVYWMGTDSWFSFCNLWMAVWNIIPFQGSDGRTLWIRMRSTRNTL